MTIEEKAKRYDEALERAREYKNHGYMMINAALDNIFPELKESEDERVKREFCKDIWTFIPNERAHKYIAWLEKQGEKGGEE